MTKTTMFKQFGFTQFTAAAISGISCRALTGFWHTGGKAQEQIRLNKNKYNVLLSFEKTSKLFLCSLKFQGRELFGGVAQLARVSALQAEGREFDAHHFHFLSGLTHLGKGG